MAVQIDKKINIKVIFMFVHLCLLHDVSNLASD